MPEIPTALHKGEPLSSRFGGFLLLTGSGPVHFTGDLGCSDLPDRSVCRVRPVASHEGHPTRKDIECADQVGMILIATLHAQKPGLCPSILFRNMPTGWTGLARMMRWHGQQHPAVPRQFIVQLPTEFAPSLVEDGSVQTGLGPYVLSGSFDRACRGRGHIPHLQVLEHHHRVVFANGRRGLVEEIMADMRHARIDSMNSGFGLLPVATEFFLSRHVTLGFGQRLLMDSETMERSDVAPVTHRRKTCNAQINTNRTRGLCDRRCHLAFRLNRHEPLAAIGRYGDVLGLANNVPAVAVAEPAQLGQEQAAVGLVDFELRGIGIAETVAQAFFLESGEIGTLGEKVGVGPFQVFERLLQRMHGRIREPCRFRAIAPLGKPLAEPGVAELLLAVFVPCLLQRECFVKHVSARPREAAHLSLLFAVGLQLVFEGLKTFHESIFIQFFGKASASVGGGAVRAILPRPEGRGLPRTGSNNRPAPQS